MKKLFLVVAMVLLSVLPLASVAKSEVLKEIRSTKASADLLINIRSGSGSVKKESGNLLREALEALNTAEIPAEFAGKCGLQDRPKVIFQSIPAKFLDKYGDRAKCEALLEKTEQSPILIENKHFSSLDALSDWVYELSRGQGEDGKKLYEQCDGECSPKYKYVIEKADGALRVKAVVICGHARDKDDNTYHLSSSYLWNCEEVDSQEK